MNKITFVILSVISAITFISCQKEEKEKTYSFIDESTYYRGEVENHYGGRGKICYNLSEYSELGLLVTTHTITDSPVGEVHNFVANENTAFVTVIRYVSVFTNGYIEFEGTVHGQKAYYLDSKSDTRIRINDNTIFGIHQIWPEK